MNNTLRKMNINGIEYILSAGDEYKIDGILLYSPTPLQNTQSPAYTTNLMFLYGNSLTMEGPNKVKVLKSGKFRVSAVAFSFSVNGINYMYFYKNEELINETERTLLYNSELDLVENDILYLYSKSTNISNFSTTGCMLSIIRIE